MYKKILVPLDGSKLAEKALDHAAELTECFDAEIILFQGLPPVPIYAAPEFVTSFVVDKKQKKAAQRYLTNLAEELKKRGITVAVKLKTGSLVAEDIIDFAKESGVI